MAFVTEKLSQGIDVVLEIDWQGAQLIREIFPKLLQFLFYLPREKP